jgi:hypothetical protein
MTTVLSSESQVFSFPLQVARLNARTSIRQMRGQTGACLLEVANDRPYVTKYQNNAFGPKVLVSEWIGNLLLRNIGLPVPSCALIEVPEDIHALTNDNVRSTLPAGVHFGSQYPDDSVSTYDFLPERLMTSLSGLDLFFGISVFDVWVSNADLRQAIFQRRHRPRPLQQKLEFLFIDNSHLFGGPDWRFVATGLTGKASWRLPYGGVSNSQELSPWLERIEDIGETTLEAIIRSVPDEWLTRSNRYELDYVGEELVKRQRLLRDFIRTFLHWNADLFPKWAIC